MIHAAIVIDEPPNNEQLLPFLSLATFKKLAAPFLLIFIFIAFFFVFLILIAFQLLAAWSCATMVKADAPEYPFYTVKGLGSNILMVLIVIEFIWGMSCLKESCKLCSIQSTSSYQATQPIVTAIMPNSREEEEARARKSPLTGELPSFYCFTTGAVW